MGPAVTFANDTFELMRAVASRVASLGQLGYLTGGAVRDAIIGRPNGDLDVSVSGDPEPVARDLATRLPATLVTLDTERHIFRLVLSGGSFVIDLTPLRGSVTEDARHRDFTIDALAIALAELGEAGASSPILDLVGGLDDLRAGTVRAISHNVFHDDPVRLLRAIRLAAELGFAIEPDTRARIIHDAHLLNNVARERVRDEFCRTLTAPGAGESLLLLDSLGLLTLVLPELEASRDVTQSKEHYWDVLKHSIETVAAAERILRQTPGHPGDLEPTPWDAGLATYFDEEVGGGYSRRLLLKVSSLMHDVAKPSTKTVESNGRIRFLGHPSLGASMTKRAMQRLRFGNRAARIVVAQVKEHLRPGLISRDGEPSRRSMYRLFHNAADAEIDTLFLSLADYLAAKGPVRDNEDWQEYARSIRGILDTWRAHPEEVRPPKLVDGHELMCELGLEPGPAVGVLLSAVAEAQAVGEITTRDSALELAGRLWREGNTATTALDRE